MIARSPSVGYIHEPFSVIDQSGICGGAFDHWFTYICESNASLYVDHLRNCIEFKYPLAKELAKIKNPKNVARLFRDYGYFTADRVSKKRPLVKDPLAFFSADWLAQTFQMDVVILIRHPAAFAGSLKQADWPFPFDHFLNQPLLLRDYLSEYTAEIEAFSADEKDIVDQAILLWNIIHSTILQYMNAHKEWYFVRHEDLSANPLGEFRTIYRFLGLDYPQSIQDDILEFSRSSSSAKLNDPLSIERDSKANIWGWKNRLTNDEIDRIREGTSFVCSHFYDDGDW